MHKLLAVRRADSTLPAMIRVESDPQQGQYVFSEKSGVCYYANADKGREFFVNWYDDDGQIKWRHERARRKPDLIIGTTADPYLIRWWVIPRNRWFNIYLHHIIRPDNDVLHDHPWWNMSILLRGGYIETTPKGDLVRGPGSVVFRFAKALHKLTPTGDCWSLFITGPVFRVWGFNCPKGWIPYYQFKKDYVGGKTAVVDNNQGECP